MDNRMLTVKEACRTLGIGRTNFYKLLSLGKIRAIRFGGRTLVPTAELAQAVANAPPVKTPKYEQTKHQAGGRHGPI